MQGIKRLCIILGVALIVVTLLIPGYAAAQQTQKPTVEPIILRLATGSGIKHYGTVLDKWFAEEVKKRSEGRVVVQVYPAGELYKADEIVEAVMTGAVDIGDGGTAHGWPDYNPVFKFTEAWFLWRSHGHIWKNIEDYRELLFPLWEKIGVKPLFLVDHGEGGFLSKVPIREVADFKGVIIRGPTQPDWEAISTLGGTPARIAGSEVYDALTRGAIDGMRMNYTGLVRRKLYEIAQYFFGGVTMSVFGVQMNMQKWNSLPKDIQDIIMEVGREAEARSFKEIPVEEEELIKVLKENCEVYVPSHEVLAEFQSALKPYYNGIIADCDKAGFGAEAKRFLEIAGR